jgi:hypothetical protein
VSAIEPMPMELTSSPAKSPANTGMSPTQVAVLLEGFDWQAALAPSSTGTQ